MILKVTDYGREHTAIGFESITIIKYGFDSNGIWQSVICKGQHPDGSWGLFSISGDYLHLDLLMHYSVFI